MSNTTERPAEDRTVLITLASRMLDIMTTPTPPAWRTWDVEKHEDLLFYGPRYEPSKLFAGGERLDEADLIRFRRALVRLEREGLVETTRHNGRLRHVRLTLAAVPVVAKMLDLDAGEVETLTMAMGDDTTEDEADGDEA